MKKPRINLMVMTEGETDQPVRSFSLPGNMARLAIWGGVAIGLLLIIAFALAVYYWSLSRRLDNVEAENVSLKRSVSKIAVIETELAYHREFTRRVAGLIGVSVPAFADSARVAVAKRADSATATGNDDWEGPTPSELTGDRARNAAGVLVTDCPPDPNNRPRGMPLMARISRGFAPREDNPALHHLGVDLAIREGVPVLATADGTVEFSGPDDVYGFLIILDHGNGFKTTYGHNSVLLVREGEQVSRGDRIAFSGNTGVSTAPHLHYQITKDGLSVDPTGFLGR